MSETDKQAPEPPRGPAATTAGEAARSVLPPRQRPRIFRTFVAIGIAALLIGAAGLAFSEARFFGDQREAARAAELTALRGELQAVNSRLATMEQAAAEAKPETALGDAAARLQTTESRLAALETQIARAADHETLTALQDRLTRLEKDSAGAMLRRAATILAIANLARAAESGGAFEQELNAVRTLAPDDPAIPPLESLVEGVPSSAELAASFPEAARAAIQSEADESAGRNPLARLWANVRRMVSVRRVGDAEGNTNADRLSRAQADLERSNLPAAVVEVSAVSGAAVQRLGPWLTRAQERLAAERAIADMNRRVAQDLVLP